MKKNNWFDMLAPIGVLLLMAYGIYRTIPASEGKAVSPASDGYASANVLRYPAGASQLTLLHIEKVKEIPAPAASPVNGHVAYDENQTVRITSPVGGRVTRLLAQPGDKVSAGQALLWMNSPDLAASIADLRKAEADLHLKEQAFRRMKILLEGGVAARKDYESAESDQMQAQAELQRAKARLKNLLPVGQIPGNGEFAVRSPISGVVADRQANPGMEVRPDNPVPLFTVTNPSTLWAIADLGEKELGNVHAGQKVMIEVDAYPGKFFPGRVLSIGEALDPSTRRAQLRCALDNPGHLLKPEMFGRITPLADSAEKVIQIPNTALLTEGLYHFVFVESAPGTLEKRRVELGLQGRDDSTVRAGLKAEERVVTAGALLLNSELTGGK